MSMMNIDELLENKNNVLERKTKIYDEILKKCHHRIKTVSKESPLMGYCLYIIPKFVYGIPLYNMEECIKYLFSKLNDNGFKVYYTHPNLLIISWLHLKEKKRVTFTLNNNDSSNDYKSITNYKPSGNLIYDTSNLNILNNKTNMLLR